MLIFLKNILQEIARDPSVEDWARLRRYASWMRKLFLGFWDPSTDTLLRLSCCSFDGFLFPKLESLRWNLNGADTTLPFFRLFLSPSLRRVSFSDRLYNWVLSPDQLAVVAKIISVLPSSLEDLEVLCNQGIEEPLSGALSSFLCQSVPSIRGFGASVHLSEAASLRLLHLPNLSRWRTSGESPRAVSTPILPSLTQFYLDEGEALPWLHFLATHGKAALQKCTVLTTSHTNARETLKAISLPPSITDSILLSSIMTFQDLVTLQLRAHCVIPIDCQFNWTDDDVKMLATALPRLKILQLGSPCPLNTCSTTVVSLMSISIHCPDLILLQTHINTKNIVGDMQRLLDGGVGHDKVKCKLQDLFVDDLPLKVDSEGMKTVAMGLRVIFPHLVRLSETDFRWFDLRIQMGLGECRQDRSNDVFL